MYNNGQIMCWFVRYVTNCVQTTRSHSFVTVDGMLMGRSCWGLLYGLLVQWCNDGLLLINRKFAITDRAVNNFEEGRCDDEFDGKSHA